MTIKDLDDMKVIKWRITDFCNYKCSYCIRRPLIEKADLKTDLERSLNAIDEIIRIADWLEIKHNKKVKVDLIGGEISCSDITIEIIKRLGEADSIGKINITTNLSRNVDWYVDLINNSKKKISITASFHPEFSDLNDYLNKATVLNKLCQFKCETVITKEAKHIDAFCDYCERHGIRYMAEENLFDESLRGTSRRNFKDNPRYEITFDDGHTELFNTRNEFIKKYGEQGVIINTEGMKCSRDWDYVYVDRDEVLSCNKTTPISKYRLNHSPIHCPRGKCTLCGHMSLI